MSSAIPTFTWEEALHEFYLHLQATRAKKTQLYYQVQIGGLSRWAIEQQIPFSTFGKRHMDRFLVSRAEEGKAPLTLHHAAVCAKAFFYWCQKNDIIERSLLTDYQVRHAPRPAQYMPTDADMQTLLKSVHDFWNPTKNPPSRFSPVTKRVFHRDRNYAVILGLLDSAARIGEMLSLKVEDYRAKERQIVIRESKGREPRVLPVSSEWVDALDIWLRQRSKIMTGQEDEGWLFVSETVEPKEVVASASSDTGIVLAGREALIARSRSLYATPRAEVEADIAARMGWGPPSFADDPPEIAAQKRLLYERLAEQGMTKSQALDVLSRFDLSIVSSQLDWLPHRGAKNPSRYLQAAIENNYEPPVAVRVQHGAETDHI